MHIQNLFDFALPLHNKEHSKTLLKHPKASIKKIISPPNFKSELFCQDKDEWVTLIQGEATMKIYGKNEQLKAGDSLFIPANTPHKIIKTSTNPLAIWLAIYS